MSVRQLLGSVKRVRLTTLSVLGYVLPGVVLGPRSQCIMFVGQALLCHENVADEVHCFKSFWWCSSLKTGSRRVNHLCTITLFAFENSLKSLNFMCTHLAICDMRASTQMRLVSREKCVVVDVQVLCERQFWGWVISREYWNVRLDIG